MLAFNMAINSYLSVFSRKEARTSKLSVTDGIRVITGAIASIGLSMYEGCFVCVGDIEICLCVKEGNTVARLIYFLN